MQIFVTKCPHCLTTFKVEEQQLEAAAGAVRCGACLSVFNAREHLVKESHSSLKTGTRPSSEVSGVTHSASHSSSELHSSSANSDNNVLDSNVLDDSAVHWTQALGNDVDKIYEYLANELDLNSDPELAAKLQHDQWGRDLLAELDEETRTAGSAPLPIQSVDFIEASHDDATCDAPTASEPSKQHAKHSQTNTGFNADADQEISHVEMPTFDDPINEQLLDLPNTFEPLQREQDTAPKQPVSDITASSDSVNIVPTYVDPVGLEGEDHNALLSQEVTQQAKQKDKQNVTGGSDDDWHEGILQELENQSRNIAASIHTALDEKDKTSQRKEPEYSLQDLANLPLRADKHEPELKPTTPTETKPTAKPAAPARQAPGKPSAAAMPVEQPNETEPAVQLPPETQAETEPEKEALANDSFTQHESLDRLGASLKAELSQEAIAQSIEASKKPFDWPALVVCVLAAFGLMIQIGYFEADALSQDKRFRPYYEHACSVLGCQLKPIEDFAKIHIPSLRVREHPTDDTALIVDANLQNDSEFDQPFPDIELIFSDQDDRPIARRRFKPNEYRGRTLKSLELLPSQQRVHVVLEIVDPNPNGIFTYRHKLHKGSA